MRAAKVALIALKIRLSNKDSLHGMGETRSSDVGASHKNGEDGFRHPAGRLHIPARKDEAG